MRSTITFLGHFGLDVRLGSARIVCDPWLSPRGAYLGSWHPFPANDHLIAAELHDAPTLFFSSPHPDHFDVETLRAFPRTPRVVIPKLASPALADQVRALGFGAVHELGDGESLDVGDGVRLSVVASTAKHLLGATLLIERDGDVIVDQNDCVLDDAALERIAARAPALHFVQFSGASYAPAVYDYPRDKMRAEVARARAAIAERFVAAARRVGARHLVPAGGPPRLLDDRRFELNFGGSIFFDTDELAALVGEHAPDLAGRLRVLAPGDVAARDNDDAEWTFTARRPYTDKRAYLESYRAARAP